MTKINQDAVIYSGDSKTLQFSIVDSAEAAKNLTGATAAKWVLSRGRNGAQLVTKTLGAGVTITDAVGGVVQVALDPADTASLAGTYYHELEITDVSGNIATVSLGHLTIRAEQN